MAATCRPGQRPRVTHIPDPSEAELIDRMQARDPHAYRVAVERHGSAMLAAARAIAGPANAEDIVQDAWLAALEALPAFERRASLKTWLLRIVANKALSRLRATREITAGALGGDAEELTAGWFDGREHWVKGAPPHWHDDSPEALLASHALQHCLDTHLARMPAAQRSAVALHDMQGLTMDAVCEMLGVSEANARVLLHRGRLRLVKMVNHFEATGEC